MSDPTHFVLDEDGSVSMVFPQGYHYEKLVEIPSGFWRASEEVRADIIKQTNDHMFFLREKLGYL